ncbi:glycosyltransferase family 2 protein [Candidatus Pacearchaeota archaeon]|nr:glycosyltransferase family 2 protein [Candidatus Pacearchaeota archaeon]
MLSIIITAFKEPKSIGKAIESIINQNIQEKYELIISAPDKETLKIAEEYSKKNKNIRVFKDPGKGKVFAINKILPRLKGEIILLTDGDVFISENSVQDLIKPFENKGVGAVTGRVMSINPRNNMLGYWSHLLCEAAHRMRLNRFKKNQFLECSGYLWAFRNNFLKEIPRDTAEDTIVPLLFYLKGYKISYIPYAEVYVKFPQTFRDFINQKIRTAKAHETLSRYVSIKDFPRMKSIKNEIFESHYLFLFPKNIREIFWTLLLFPVRLYIWFAVFFKRYIKKEYKVDNWKRIDSTK